MAANRKMNWDRVHQQAAITQKGAEVLQPGGSATDFVSAEKAKKTYLGPPPPRNARRAQNKAWATGDKSSQKAPFRIERTWLPGVQPKKPKVKAAKRRK